MTSPKLSLLTVNYGASEKIIQLYESLLLHTPHTPWEWIIVDNNSRHDDGQKLYNFFDQKKDPYIRVLLLPNNVGFGRANDIALKSAIGEIIAFVNPDIQILKNTWAHLISAITSEEKVGIVTPILHNEEGALLENSWDFPTFLGLLKRRIFPHEAKQILEKNPFPVPWVQGSFLVLKKNFYETLGGFDHRFFLFFEDTDLCRRTWELGFRVLQIPQSVAIHESKRLSGKGLLQSFRRKTFWIHVFSMILYFWKWRKSKTPTLF